MNRPARESDYDFFYRLYMHPVCNPYLLYERMDRDGFRPIFDDLLCRGVIYIYHQADIPMGMFKLEPLKYRTQHIVYLGGIAIDPEFGGAGHGSNLVGEAVNLSLQRGFKRIELSVATENEKAIHLYEKAGFQKEGILRKYAWLESENRFLDEYLMSRIVE